MQQMLWLKGWLGIELDPVSWKEKLVSGLGGLVSIFLVAVVCHNVLNVTGAAILIASMGGSAVLLFAVPHGALSQPWPVIAGHGISALIGVFCAQHIPYMPLAAATAVGGSILAMHIGKCIHAPGGATALAAVVGGTGFSSLGYSFVWCPVLLNALILIAVAVVFNSFLPWRRYPAFLNRSPQAVTENSDKVTHEEVVAALESFDSFVDITEDDLIRLHHLLSKRVESRPLPAPKTV
jgi:CBS-domain-containing membrane protein